jgi:hypothetical protein
MACAMCSVHEAKCSDTADISTQNSDPERIEFPRAVHSRARRKKSLQLPGGRSPYSCPEEEKKSLQLPRGRSPFSCPEEEVPPAARRKKSPAHPSQQPTHQSQPLASSVSFSVRATLLRSPQPTHHNSLPISPSPWHHQYLSMSALPKDEIREIQ